MATIAELNAEACADGLAGLNDHQLLVMIATILNTDMLTVDELNTLACSSGLATISSNHFLLRYIATLLNNGAGGGGTGTTETFSGAGSPEGSQVGSPGNTYYRTSDQTFWVKASGTATNTGWIQVV